MIFNNALLLSLPVLSVLAGQAPVIKNNPKKVVALADFPAGYDQKVLGYVTFTSPNGTVKVHVDMTGLPKEGGPFTYHIHKNAVPANGECLATETHFNPYDAPADCDSQQDDSYCQVGDLSGKHGWVNTTCYETTYYDPYLSLDPKSKSYIIGKSINFHFANQTRFACANIELADDARMKQQDLEGYQFEGFAVDDELLSESELNASTLDAESENQSAFPEDAGTETETTTNSDAEFQAPYINVSNHTVNGTYSSYNGSDCESDETPVQNDTTTTDICENNAPIVKNGFFLGTFLFSVFSLLI